MLLQATYPTCPLMPETQDTNTPTWNSVCHITYTRDTWVKLLEPPSEYAFDEAKLLCQESPDTWVVWIPDRGQAVLNRQDFYC